MTRYGRQRIPGQVDAVAQSPNGLSDSFNRADGSMGSTDGIRLGDPALWVAGSGTWSISGNQAACASASFASVAVDSGFADNITSVKIGAIGSGNFGFTPRYVNNTNYLWILLANSIYISSYTSGVNSNHANTAPGAYSVGDVISVRCVGSSIEVFRNGASVLTSTRTEHQTATKQGLIQNGSGNKWDDFLVTPP